MVRTNRYLSNPGAAHAHNGDFRSKHMSEAGCLTRGAISSPGEGPINPRQCFPPDCLHSRPFSTTTSMSNEKASISSRHSGMEKESTTAVAAHEQMTGWRRLYYSPLIQIFLLGFILFMYVFPD